MQDTMENEVTRKKPFKKGVLIGILCAVALCAASVAALFAMGALNGNERVDSEKLYWNIDGETFVNDSASGLTSRRKIDGFFSVRFFTDGQIVEYKVKDPRLMIQIDRRYLMGLVFDEEGVITDFLDVEDVSGGEIASYFYVMNVDGNKITANSMDNGTGITQEFEIGKDTAIYNVTATDDTCGQVCDSLLPYDRIRVILDKKGRIDTVFLIKRDMTPGYCEHCGGEALWRQWTDPLRLPETEGHWRLLNDVQLTDRQAVVNSGNTVVLDLNGKTVRNLYGKRLYALFYEDAHLSIMDTSQEQTGRLVIDGSYNGQGMLVWVRYGTFKLYGGTLDCSNGISTGNGIAVCTSANTIFDMYGGTIIGGVAETALNDQGKYTQATGGSVFVAKDSIFNMYGGTIRDGYAKRMLDENGANKGGVGGNIYIASGGTFNMYGGQILDGKAEGLAGNIGMGGKNAVFNLYDGVISGGSLMYENRNSGNLHVAAGAFFNMYGGTIKDGMATAAGGNVTLYGKMTMSGGLITGGKIMTGDNMDQLEETEANNANIHCRNGDLILTGGQIDGYVYVQNADADGDGELDTHIFEVSGNPVISGGSLNLTLMGDMVMDMGELSEGADICMSSGGFVTNETSENNLNYVRFDEDLIKGQMVENKMFFGKYQCLCGGKNGHIGDCTGVKQAWKPMTGNTLPTLTGNYYLIRNVKDAVQSVLSKDAVVSIDLNGYTITMGKNPGAAKAGGTYNYYRAFVLDKENTVLNISDSRGGGKIVSGVRGDNGMVINVQAAATVNLYGGILDGTAAKQTTATSMSGIVQVAKGGIFNMYGGQILGLGKITRIDKETNCPAKNSGINTNGAAVYVAAEGCFCMHGGTITGGTAHKGGSVYVNTDGVFVMETGRNCQVPVITGGNAREGGNLYLTGAGFELVDGVVEKGTAQTYGGNIYVNSGSNVSITGGEIYGGIAGTDGANVFVGGNKRDIKEGDQVVETVVGKVTVTGGTIYGGFTTSGNTVTLGGNAQILDQEKDSREVTGLQVTGGAKITLMPLEADADICIDTTGVDVAVLTEGTEETLTDKVSAGAVSVKADPELQIVITADVLGLKTLRYKCLCGQQEHIGKCDGTVLVWQKWTGRSLPAVSGNYYLDADITEASQATVNKVVNINLDLNGHTVTMAPNPAAAVEGGTYNYFRAYALIAGSEGTMLNITDSVGGGRIVSGVRADGGAIINMQCASCVSIYGGVLDGTATLETTTKNITGVVSVAQGGSFTVYGGQVLGYGNITLIDKTTNTASGGEATPQGSAVYLSAGSSFSLSGGKIVGGAAANGGAVWTAGNVTVSGGEIVGGEAANGGSLYADGGSITINGGKIYGGSATKFGGNLHINNATDLNITGGEIYGGSAPTGPNIFVGGNKKDIQQDGQIVETVYGTVTLSGGTVYGGVTTSGNTVILAGKLRILDEEKDATQVAGLVLTGTAKATVKPLEEGADIRVDTQGRIVATLTEGAEETVADRIKVGSLTSEESPGASVVIDDGTLAIVTLRYSCLCGQQEHIGDCDGTKLLWQKWTEKTLPIESGNYYLEADIQEAGQATISKQVQINLDLNGHTVTMAPNTGAQTQTGTWNYYRAFVIDNSAASSVLTITDSVGTGKIVSGVRSDSGSVIRLQANATVNLYGGTLDGSTMTQSTDANVYGIVEMQNGLFNMYGGKITGIGEVKRYQKGSADQLAENTDVTTRGGAVRICGGVFNMYGGEIYGGKASYGGSVIAESGGQFNILSHEKCAAPVISGGSAREGGNVYVAGATFTMQTGSVTGGTASSYGGNIYVNHTSFFTMTGGEISGGCAVNGGNNLFAGSNAAGSTVITGGIIYGGFTTSGTTVSIGGDLQILDTNKDGTDSAYGLMTTGSAYVSLLPLDENADIRVDGSNGRKIAVFGEGAQQTYNGQVTVAKSSQTVDNKMFIKEDDDGLKITDGKTACICTGSAEGMEGHTCQELTNWIDWGNTDAEKIAFPATAGSYRLVSDICLESQKTISSGVFNLDLNGYSITVSQNPASGALNYFRGVVLSGGTLNITDTAGGGKIISGVRQDSGSIIRIWNSNSSTTAGTLNLFGGTLDGSNMTQSTSASLGGAVEIANNGVFNMYGGTVIGIKDVMQYRTGTGGALVGAATVNGGAVFVNKGTFNMYGGEIYGGVDKDGTADNIHIAANGAMKMTGGEIYGGVYTASNSLSVGKEAQILGINKDGDRVNGLTLASGKYITALTGVDALMEKAKIYVTSVGKIAVGVTEDTKECFQVLTVGCELSLTGDVLSIVAAS